MIDLSGLLGIFGTGALTVTRRGAATLSAGFWTPGTTSTITLTDAVVHPLTGRQLEALPEGLRTREPLAVFSATALRTAAEPAGVGADTFTWGGVTYEVQTVENWAANGNFYRHVAVKVPVA